MEEKNIFKIIIEYFKERQTLFYFLAGLGIGSAIGKTLIWIGLFITLGILIYLQFYKKKV